MAQTAPQRIGVVLHQLGRLVPTAAGILPRSAQQLVLRHTAQQLGLHLAHYHPLLLTTPLIHLPVFLPQTEPLHLPTRAIQNQRLTRSTTLAARSSPRLSIPLMPTAPHSPAAACDALALPSAHVAARLQRAEHAPLNRVPPPLCVPRPVARHDADRTTTAGLDLPQNAPQNTQKTAYWP